MSRNRLYDICAVLPGGELYFFQRPKPKPFIYADLHLARVRDFARAVRLLLSTGYEAYPIVFKLVEVTDTCNPVGFMPY